MPKQAAGPSGAPPARNPCGAEQTAVCVTASLRSARALLVLQLRMLIVLVSPYPSERDALKQLLANEGYRVTAVAARQQAVELADRARADVVIADAQVVGLDGAALVGELAERNVRAQLILLCSRATRWFETRDFVCLPKPVDLALLHRHIDDLMADRVA
jgi:CheY-like chemotaxis protein